ncbi:S-4TM family putative pore-forming effector [Arthrobacter sp. TE12232]
MSSTDPSYRPPSANDVAKAQNLDANLKLLLAQRRLYSKTKIWTSVRGVGVGVVAIGAPILTAIWPEAAVPAATVAAVWYVLNHVLFKFLERRGATRAATIQEQFDTTIFGMPTIAVRELRVLPEDISQLTGAGAGARASRRYAYSIERLRDWYSIQKNVPGAVAIAIAQRGNVAYSRRLLDRNAALWLGLLVTWAIMAVTISITSGFSLATFLLVVAIPVMPPLLDAWDEFQKVRAAGREREALANEIQDAISTNRTAPIQPEQLVAWQSQLFALRRDAPLVPDWLYNLLRDRNETEMSDAARALGEDAQTRKEDVE